MSVNHTATISFAPFAPISHPHDRSRIMSTVEMEWVLRDDIERCDSIVLLTLNRKTCHTDHARTHTNTNKRAARSELWQTFADGHCVGRMVRTTRLEWSEPYDKHWEPNHKKEFDTSSNVDSQAHTKNTNYNNLLQKATEQRFFDDTHEQKTSANQLPSLTDI